MKRSKYTDEQILAIVKEGEAGRKVADLCRANGITEQTYYRWKAKYGGMELSELQRMKQLEDENRRLKTHRRRADAGDPGVETGGGKKVVGPIARREAVGRLRAQGMSLRRACRLIGLSTSTWRCERQTDPINAQLLARLTSTPASVRALGIGASTRWSIAKGCTSITNASTASIGRRSSRCVGVDASDSRAASACRCPCPAAGLSAGRWTSWWTRWRTVAASAR